MKRTMYTGFKLALALLCGVLLLGQAAAAAAQLQAPDDSNAPQVITHYLPLTLHNKQWGYWGHVTDNGVPVDQALLEMRYYNGSGYVTWTTTRTDQYGFYYFPDPPVLSGAQSYYIRWLNPGNPVNKEWLEGWWCDDITAANQYAVLWRCDIDVMNVKLVKPLAGGTIGLPYWMAWEPRYLPLDSYDLQIFDPVDMLPWWNTGGMGWAHDFIFWNLPPGGFVYNYYYAWTIWVYADNGFGVANEGARPVEFMPTPQEGATFQAGASAGSFSWAEWIEQWKIEHPGQALNGSR